jgi:hypothetical protein
LWQQKPAAQKQIDLQLLLLLPGVLLHRAARIPSSSSLRDKYCMIAAQLADNGVGAPSLRHWKLPSVASSSSQGLSGRCSRLHGWLQWCLQP